MVLVTRLTQGSLRRFSSSRATPGPVQAHRLNVWEAVARRAASRLQARFDQHGARKITFVNPDPSWLAPPMEGSEIVKPGDLPWIEEKEAALARVRIYDSGKVYLWDKNRPLYSLLDRLVSENVISPQKDVLLELEADDLKSAQGMEVLWHSAAHVLGYALEEALGDDKVWLDDGPALSAQFLEEDDDGNYIDGRGLQIKAGTGGFFYDFEFVNKNEAFPVEDSFVSLAKAMKKICQRKHRFECVELEKSEAMEMFKLNPRKLEIIHKLDKDAVITAYKCGNFIDLCRGPHLANTGNINRGGIKLLKGAALHAGPHEQRAYGIAFLDKEDLIDWAERTKNAAQRDHRNVGRKQKLFHFDECSPGSAFMLPHGTLIFNRLVTMLRDQYEKYGYQEVMSPLIYANSLWDKSGHLANYKENMYRVMGHMSPSEENKRELGLKPMNCPGHCVLFASSSHSFRELPVRFADFSALHRNEASGALGGMTRLRKFHQDDAHIFCRPDQIESEILACIQFVSAVYEDLFGFRFQLALSTRPLDGKRMGTDVEWDSAEAALKKVLKNSHLKWELNEGEAAFYGPKIDISIFDAIGRKHQCATIQLDFQLPERFDLEYVDSKNVKRRPVMIHRAILGSVERFMAILLESTNGKLPFWLSPRQIAILPVDPWFEKEARSLASKLRNYVEGDFLKTQTAGGLSVFVDESRDSISKRVRNAQQAPFNVICVFGKREIESNTIAVRSNDGSQVFDSLPVESAIEQLKDAVQNRRRETFPFKYFQA